MVGYEGFFYHMNLVVNFDVFYNFLYISALDGSILKKIGDQIEDFLML